MTRQQLEEANALDERIKRLKKIRDRFVADASSFDESLRRMTGFYIVDDHNGRHFSENINQGEIMFLIEAYGREIERLEQELAKL